jgi:hypothetical protein
MIYSKPTDVVDLPYSTIKVNGCSNNTVGFQFLENQQQAGRRRYCNKVLVHECITVPEDNPMDLSRVEFMATSDPCYRFFELFKSSESVEGGSPTVTLQLNIDSLVEGVLVDFLDTETCCLPTRMAYRLYGYITDTEDRVLLSNGSLYVSPCTCDDCGSVELWTEVDW